MMKVNTKMLLAANIAAGIVYTACRKVDRVVTPPTNNSVEEKFFASHRSNDATEKALVSYLQRVNNQKHFVEQTVKQIGYPRWDKMLASKKKDNTKAGRNSSADSTYIYNIPFVRENSNVVNASMIISTIEGDTTFKFLCDWQYRDSASTGISARGQSLLLMSLDKNVFGERIYKITDTNAYGNDEDGRNILYVKLNSSSGTNINGRSNQAARSQSMQLIIIPYCTSTWVPAHQGQMTGCAPGAPDCNDYIKQTTCENQYYWVYVEDGGQGGGSGGSGGNGGSGNGGNGNGGGGSGSGGGSTPPNCTPGQNPPCTPGWIPEEDGGANLPPNDSTIAAILKRLIIKSGNTPDSIFTLAHAQTPTKEWVYSINVVRGGDTVVQNVKAGGSFDADAVIGLNTIAIAHVHNEDDANGGDKNSCISPGDIYKFYKNRVIDLYLYNYSIVITRDYYYAAVITDAAKFRDYIRLLCGTLILKDINFQLEDLYKTGMTNCQSGCNWQKLTEYGVLSLTNNNNSSISGIKIFRSSRTNVNFTLLTP